MALRIPIMTKCCCCIPLRIGCLIIGYVTMLISCLTLAVVSWYIYKLHEFVENSKVKPNPEHPPAEVAKNAICLYACLGYYMVAFLFNFIINLILVIGVHTNNPRLLKSYCYATLVLFTLGLGLVVVTSIFMGFMVTVGMLKWCFTLVFVAIIVRSTYLEMEEQNKPPMQEMVNLYNTQQAPLMA